MRKLAMRITVAIVFGLLAQAGWSADSCDTPLKPVSCSVHCPGINSCNVCCGWFAGNQQQSDYCFAYCEDKFGGGPAN